MATKYHSRKITVDGMTFDSKKEYKRFCELRLLEKAGAIQNLRCQVRFELIPIQRETITETDKSGRTKASKGKILERECAYFADFVYTDADGHQVVEDTKGYRTTDYIIKRKLMLWVHGIRIREI